jgi:hypothetical protein
LLRSSAFFRHNNTLDPVFKQRTLLTNIHAACQRHDERIGGSAELSGLGEAWKLLRDGSGDLPNLLAHRSKHPFSLFGPGRQNVVVLNFLEHLLWRKEPVAYNKLLNPIPESGE